MEGIPVDRLFQDSLLNGLSVRPTETAPLKVVQAIPADVRRELSIAVLDLLKSELAPDALELSDERGVGAGVTQLDRKLFTLKKDGVTDRIVFLRIKDVVADAVLPTFSLGVAAATGGGRRRSPRLRRWRRDK